MIEPSDDTRFLNTSDDAHPFSVIYYCELNIKIRTAFSGPAFPFTLPALSCSDAIFREGIPQQQGRQGAPAAFFWSGSCLNGLARLFPC